MANGREAGVDLQVCCLLFVLLSNLYFPRLLSQNQVHLKNPKLSCWTVNFLKISKTVFGSKRFQGSSEIQGIGKSKHNLIYFNLTVTIFTVVQGWIVQTRDSPDSSLLGSFSTVGHLLKSPRLLSTAQFPL